MTEFAGIHQFLHETYGHFYQGDSMIPHMYTPAQKAILAVIGATAIESSEALIEKFQQQAETYGASHAAILEEVLTNALVLAWLNDQHRRFIGAV